MGSWSRAHVKSWLTKMTFCKLETNRVNVLQSNKTITLGYNFTRQE